MGKRKKPIEFLDFCPVGYTIDFVSKKWALYIIRELDSGPKRYSEIYNALHWGISPKILTQRLKELEKEGMISKKRYNEIPPRVEYKLTKMGKEFSQSFKSIEKWSKKWITKQFDVNEKP